jgi:CheY-like chemotaxis protein
VVVVDDDPRWRALAAEPFLKRGDRVRECVDGLQALATCLQDPPDVILSDVQMPRMDGWQFLRTVRGNPALATVPVVFLTSLDGDAERLRGYQLGVDAYLPKPFQPDELLLRVHRLVRRAKGAETPLTEVKHLRGDIEHVSTGSLLSFLSIEKKTGVLLLVADKVVRVFVADGRPLCAIEEGKPKLPSKTVLMDALDWTTGQFDFNDEDVDAEDELRADASALVLEHARMKDEGRR